MKTNNYNHLRYARSIQGINKPPQKEIAEKLQQAEQKYSTNQARMQPPNVNNW